MSEYKLSDMLVAIKSGQDEFVHASEETQDYMDRLQDAGMVILKDVDNDQIKLAMVLIQTLVVSKLLDDGDLSERELKMFMSEKFQEILVISLKCSIGIASVEGWTY